MRRSRFTEQQIAFALQQAEQGTPVAEVVGKMGISEQPPPWRLLDFAHRRYVHSKGRLRSLTICFIGLIGQKGFNR
jgi:hypothetical protein